MAIDSDRLDELATYQLDDDTPPDAKVRIPAGDLRDLVALIPVVRAAMAGSDEWVRGYDAREPLTLVTSRSFAMVQDAVRELRKGRG